MLGAALELARAGWAVFPCRPTEPRAKSPLLPHGHLEATTDPDRIRAWWTRWPAAMLGAPVPKTLIVVDIDPRNGGSMEALEERVGPVPVTLTVWSGRGDGGRHLYFLRPPGTFTSTGLPSGVDLKANGYCILPPSIHPASGKPYRWEIHEPASLPAGLLALLRPPERKAPPAGASAAVTKGEPLVRHVLGLPDGNRNNGLYWAACTAAEEGILELLKDDLLRAAVAIGLPEREAKRTIDSAARVGAR